MNFYDALSIHLAWKLRLREYIDGQSSEYLEAGHVAREDTCELGHWIHAQYPDKKHLPEFMRVRELHADFHRSAGEIVQAVNQGAVRSAESMLHNDYVHLSAMLVKSITKLNKVLVESEKTEEVAA